MRQSAIDVIAGAVLVAKIVQRRREDAIGHHLFDSAAEAADEVSEATPQMTVPCRTLPVLN